MVDFVPFPGMASTDNNTQYPPNQVMVTGYSGTVTASGSMESNPLHAMSPPLDEHVQAQVGRFLEKQS